MRFTLLFLLLAGCAAAEAPEPQPMQEEQTAAREVIATDGAPAALGPYSQAVRVGNTLYCAGQIGLDPATGQLVEGGIEAETRRTLDNLKAILETGGFTMEDVVQVEVYLVDLADFGAMNDVYATYFSTAPPARAASEVTRLPRDARVEIMLTAAK